jgi:signal transduction histidine kinase
MTLRLVALMSVVLLLSLAAFGLAMNHYQDQVMEEVTRTASVVGQAALRTMDHHRLAQMTGDGSPTGEAVMLWKTACPDPESENCSTRTFTYEVRRTDGMFVGPTLEGTNPEDHQRIVELTEPGIHRIRQQRMIQSGDDSMAVLCEATGDEIEQLDCETEFGPGGDSSGFDARLFISVDRVHAVSDPGSGLVLKIPTFTSEGTLADVTNTFDIDDGSEHMREALEEINLRIPVEQDYDALFASIRGRSLILFLGVFVVGTALSAGLASRFTRPIRRLDGGIRQLSGGDLDVKVEVHGKDEIARLGRAFNDMTRRLRANRDRSRELVRKEKLSALGRLAAGVAHDVRNPLHSIGLTLDHLTETGRPQGEERAVEFDRSLEIIRGEIRRLDRLVGNFISFAGSERGERQSVDLTELLHETVRLVHTEATRRGVEVELEIDEATGPVVGDGEALRSSILNLVLNSFEAMPDGGRLSLRLRPHGGGVELEVADTGRGIPEEDQDRVFDFAYTTRENGNGMGLAMVHHCIVESHGGRVTLNSRPGEGTRVALASPRGPAAQREQS